ncbi:hypothetical protein P7C73_g2728, partial [Tremellales sp. Uapishka_1]
MNDNTNDDMVSDPWPLAALVVALEVVLTHGFYVFVYCLVRFRPPILLALDALNHFVFASSPVQDDGFSDRGDSGLPDDGKGSSTQVRKAQNRIAQREFRLRKQQYIRDLEAKVEVLSGDKEERIDLMTLLVRNLLQENKDLRGMIKNMATFVGDGEWLCSQVVQSWRIYSGLGSCLPRLGLSAPQLEAILSKADTDTAYEAFINLKASREMEAANPGIKVGELKRRTTLDKDKAGKRKRGSFSVDRSSDAATPEDVLSASLPGSSTSATNGPKRPRAPTQLPSFSDYAYLFPDMDLQGYSYPPAPLPPLQPPQPTLAEFNSMFNFQSPQSSVFPGFGLSVPAYPQSQPISSLAGQRPISYPSTDYAATHAPPPTPQVQAEVERQKTLRAAVANLTRSDQGTLDGPVMTRDEVEKRIKLQQEFQTTLVDNGMQDDRKMEALQMIAYHLNNFRLNHSYHLPISLRPTALQRTIPHELAIDGIIWPIIRDRMILYRGRYDLVSAFHGVMNDFAVHGDDTLDHRNWEISEKWLLEFRSQLATGSEVETVGAGEVLEESRSVV